MLAVAGVCLYIWTRVPWFGGHGYEHSGYNFSHFIALIIVVYTTPVGMISILVPMQHLLRRTVQPILKAGLAFLFVALFAAGAIYCGLIAQDPLFRCFYVGCINSGKDTFDPNHTGEGGQGWLSGVGTGAFFVLLGLGASIVCAVVASTHRLDQYLQFDKEGSSLIHSEPKSGHVLFRTRYKRDCAIYMFFMLPVFLFFFFVTTTVPNQWYDNKANRIAAFAQEQIASSETDCESGKFTCPEVADATFRTFQIKFNDYWYLKFFPGNVLYYSFLIGCPGIMMLVRSANPTLRSKMKRHRTLWGYPISYGELLACVVFLILLTMWCIYWWGDHNFDGLWPRKTYDTKYYTQRMARGFGQVAVLFFSLLVIPAARTSVFHMAFDVSWEVGVKYHRALGYLFLAAAFLHMISTYVWYWYQNGNLRDTYRIPLQDTPAAIDNWTVPLISWVLWTSFFIYALAIVEPIRRKFWELFYYLHIFGFLILVPAVAGS